MKTILTIILTILFISCTEQTSSAGASSFSFEINYQETEYKAIYMTAYSEKNSVRTEEFSGLVIYPNSKKASVTIGRNYIEIDKTKYDFKSQQIALYDPKLKTLSYFETKLSKKEYTLSKTLKKETEQIIQKSVISKTKNI